MAIRIGLNLSAVQEDLRKDLLKTMSRIAKIGYHGVELAGALDYLPGQLRHCLEGSGLACACAHVSCAELELNLEDTLTFHQRLGNRLLIVSELPWDRLDTPQAWRNLAEQFNAWSDKLAWMEMQVGLHLPERGSPGLPGGSRFWAAFLEQARPDVVLQVDAARAQEAGMDPVALMRANPARCRSLHLAANGQEPDSRVAEACREIQPDWVIADLAGQPGPTWDAVEKNFRFILDKFL